MKKLFVIAAAVAMFAGCAQNAVEPKVMARFVPERMDDFVFENDLACGRIYGKALEGNPTSPGVDIWVKTPGKLVADERYLGYLTEGDAFYHHDHGNGKDCYKVSVSLGGGATSPVVDGVICYPATNYREYEVLEQSEDKVVFTLSYPEWDANGVKVSLVKKITVTPGTYFFKSEDTYTFDAPELTIAAGVFRHPAQETIETEICGTDRYAVWEHASDQSVEPEDGMLGVAVVVPGAQAACVSEDGMHGLVAKTVKSGETFTYYFGSCWSKADVKTAEDWFAIVNAVK